MKKHNQGIKVVVIGGGTGTFMVLSALKNYVTNITAVINMVDNGGSTGLLRDEFGVLPPGDVRSSLVALSPSSDIMRELFNYRFSCGTFGGHSFGNLFLTVLEKITGSFAQAVKTAGEILHVTGKVIPVTTDDIHLNAERPDGTIIRGQKMMIKSDFKKGENIRFYLEPKAHINPDAKKAILEADLVVLGPGNLHSSLIPILLVDGIPQALKKTQAKKVYVSNLMTQAGQTEGFTVCDFVNEIEKYVGKKTFDFVVYNNTRPPQTLLDTYAREGEALTVFQKEEFVQKDITVVGEKLFSSKVSKPKAGDNIPRPLIRHDGDKLARLLMKIYFS